MDNTADSNTNNYMESKKMNMTEQERKTLMTFIETVEQFRTLDPDMPTQTMLTFLYTKVLEQENEFATVREIAGKLRTSSSSASRNVLAHTDVNRQRKAGTGLLETHENPMKRNEKIVRFTSRGERVYESIMSRLAAS